MSVPEFEVNFHFGVKKIKQRDVFITALLLNMAVSLLVKFLKVSPIQLWMVIDDLGRSLHIKLINQLILQSPELLSERISRDVDKAINEYKDVVEWEEPKVRSVFSELEEGETPLGGEMRRRGDWVDN
jgi:hypothetical protein